MLIFNISLFSQHTVHTQVCSYNDNPYSKQSYSNNVEQAEF